jgi:hypothetical protein
MWDVSHLMALRRSSVLMLRIAVAFVYDSPAETPIATFFDVALVASAGRCNRYRMRNAVSK